MRFWAVFTMICTLILTGPAQAQVGLGFGIGTAPFGNRFENIRMGAVARGHIEAHLKAEYQRLCAGKDIAPQICAKSRPYYKSAFLPVQGEPLPTALLDKIGFVHPGTDYRQVGFSIYLIRLPDRRIHDVVSIWGSGWK